LLRAFTVDQITASLQDDPRLLAVAEVRTGRRDFSLKKLIADTVRGDAVPSHRFHVFIDVPDTLKSDVRPDVGRQTPQHRMFGQMSADKCLNIGLAEAWTSPGSSDSGCR